MDDKKDMYMSIWVHENMENIEDVRDRNFS